MPPTKSRKRRAAGDLISPEVSDHDDVTPRTQRSQGQAGNRRPRQVSSSDDDDDDDDDEDDAGDTTLGTDARSDIVAREQLVKKLVRLALASEYARQPIRRTDISAKGPPPGLTCFLA
ncbi:MAG: hypothetical protein M1815_005082 [Lichina confinis]|nr:MAG: hypothetical protein M1815_005082 [Lichina confinis]